jgi:selenide,water dikinase
MNTSFDLLSTVEDGGCSAKLPAGLLSEILGKLPVSADPRLLVDVDTHDDAGVYKINDELALIFTTDFFPPICSDALEFGEIAAANALSDVFAMGGTPLMALNLMMFSQGKNPPGGLHRDPQRGTSRRYRRPEPWWWGATPSTTIHPNSVSRSLAPSTPTS